MDPRIPLRLAACLALVVLGGLAPAQQPPGSAPVLGNTDVVALVRANQPAKEIVRRIKDSACRFDTSVSGLRRLKLAGIPEPVLMAMIAAPAEPSTESPPPASVADDGPASHCPKCLIVAVSHYDAASRSYRPGWVSPGQARWLVKDLGDSLSGRVTPGFWYTSERTVAQYDFAWNMQSLEGVQAGAMVGWVAVYDASTGVRVLTTSCQGAVRGEDPMGRCLADAALQLRRLLKRP